MQLENTNKRLPVLKTDGDCCGCTACMAICPKDAIEMVPDKLGFKYPKVDGDKCIKCLACERVCSFKDDYDTPQNFSMPITLGVRHKDMSELMKSRSGGTFAALSDYVLDNGGVVYGAGFKDHFTVAHKRAISREQRDEMRGSKYVQSDLSDIFRQVKSDLKNGKLVLFSGTPCQTSGLSSYIGNKMSENLILVDIVCHGTPAPYVWRDYLEWVEKRHHAKAIGVNFRDKIKKGWRAHWETIQFENKSYTTNHFTYMFEQHLFLRDSCSKCHFTNFRRPSDITLADFWGWEKTDSDFNKDNKGASLVLLNTPKGERIFSHVKDGLNVIVSTPDKCVQPHLKAPSKHHACRSAFESDYASKGFKYVFYKYGNIGFRYTVKLYLNKIKNRIKRYL